jgi:isopentenyl-diphosphate delta-isomerase
MHRSRLAEAYVKSLKLPGFEVSSSGVQALGYEPQAKSGFTAEVLKRHPELQATFTKTRTQTTDEMLAAQDILVCLDKSVYDDAVRWFGLDARKTQMWRVADIDKRIRHTKTFLKDWSVVAGLEEDIFSEIRSQCDKLVQYLTATSWTEITDKNNKPLGLRLPIAWANDRGLWHRAAHVVMVTSDGKFVVEKRSKQIVFAPGLLDISLGGSVDVGESPLHAAVRETREELGLRIAAERFKPLFVHRWASHHPHYHKFTRAHLYTYFVQLPSHVQLFDPQKTEVDRVLVLNKRYVRNLLKKHYLRRLGGLSGGYKYYAKAVRYSLKQIA